MKNEYNLCTMIYPYVIINVNDQQVREYHLHAST